MTKISIIIVTLNEEDNIKSCLDSLMAMDYPTEDVRIIVSDGGSTDNTLKIIKKYPIKSIIKKGSGVAESKNIALNMCIGEYVVFIDADVNVSKNWLKELVRAMKTAKDDIVAVGGPNLIMENDYEMAKIIGYAQELFFGSGGSPQSNPIKQEKEVISISNCNVLYRYNVIKENEFDEKFNIGDDLEINFRLRLKGYKFLYVPSAIVYHRRPKNLKKLMAQSIIYSEAMARVTKKFRKIPRWYAPFPSIALISIVSFPFLYLIMNEILYIYTLFVTLYIIGLLISTFQVYKKNRTRMSFLTLIIIPLQHLSYGYGYLKEMIRSIK